MQVVILKNMIYVQLEDRDFRTVGGAKPYLQTTKNLSNWIAEEERHYEPEDKVWIIENTRDNRGKVEDIVNNHNFAMGYGGEIDT